MLEIVYRKTSELIPYARNSRTHSTEQVQQIAGSIKEFGFTNPILIDEKGGIIAGHGRVMGANLLKMKEVPTITLQGLTEAQKKAYIIADNKLALNAGWDEEMLKIEIEELYNEGFNIDLTGFNLEELEDMGIDLDIDGDLPEVDESKADEVPEIEENPVIKLGDLIELGHNYQHRLLCGDSTKEEDVIKLMEGKKADMVFTSPPYNANAKTGDGDIFSGKKSKDMYKGEYVDNMDSEKYVEFASKVLNICFTNTEGFIFWNVSYNSKSKNEYIKQIIPKIDFLIEQVVWKKTSTIPFKGMLMRDYEPIFIFSTNKKALGVEKVTSNVWEISNMNSQTKTHKAAFPVALPEKAILLVKPKNNIVLDVFNGSGSTLIASENNYKFYRGIELDPMYCQQTIQRYVDYTSNPKIKINGIEVNWLNYKAMARND